MKSKKNALVIGYGNLLRGDDGAGRRVVQRLEEDPEVSSRCELLSCHQLLPEHAGIMPDYGLVVFVDASYSDMPGCVSLQDLTKTDGTGRNVFPDPHSMKPEDVISGARVLYGACPRVYLCRIGASEFKFSDRLSSLVRKGVENAAGRIKKVVNHDCRYTSQQKDITQ